tara:strand:+ start:66 stop:308 length:243 start_codon:yes stop_codon:yes gene_type:complete
MTRQELKQMWISLPHSNPINEIKIIRVEKVHDNHYYVEQVTDVKDYWSTNSLNFNNMYEAMKYARKIKDKGYELFIHGST